MNKTKVDAEQADKKVIIESAIEGIEESNQVPAYMKNLEKAKAAKQAKKEGVSTEQVLEDKDNTATIVIEEQDGDENQGDVFVGLNGRAFLIQRGVEVTVPIGVLSILKNAIQTKLIQDIETREKKYKDVPRFNVRIVR
jgi:hypothetical protein